MSGWCLIWAYLFIGLAGTTGFTIFAGKLLAAMGITVRRSSCTRLYRGLLHPLLHGHQDIDHCESGAGVCSVTLILVLCAIVLFNTTLRSMPRSSRSPGFSWMNLGLGVVVAVFSLVGFESSTAFGEEATEPDQDDSEIDHLESDPDRRVLRVRQLHRGAGDQWLLDHARQDGRAVERDG